MKTIAILFTITFFAFQMQAQQIKITGNVTDDTGMPLPGVNILEKGSRNGTQTDFDGNYEIMTETGKTLVYAYVGFESEERKVKTNPVINVKMQAGAVLEEVVVTAYSKRMEKKALGYAVSNIVAESVSGRNWNHDITETESYGRIEENTFKSVATSPLSTFSIDVDKAGYSNIRRMINNGQEIPKDAVKIEEMINYFAYDYAQPKGNEPFSINTEIAISPWNEDAKLVKIGIKGREIPLNDLVASNLVFLLDVSGSMEDPNKLPLLKAALQVLVNQLRESDKVSIVVYAGAAGLVLKPTSGADKKTILEAIDRLNAGGSTAGGAGIELAYKIAQENFIKGGNNRIILATDGDFNVGASSDRSMEDLIVEKRKSGIFLTCLGFGMGNYQDSKMETLADKGNGNHAYIDTMQEAQKILGTEFFGTIYTIAKDVKIQVEFNPLKVQAYRLIGYENRLLNNEDFKDDTKDAGELGSGHTVTAFYEIIPVGVKSEYLKDIPELKYTKTESKGFSDEMLTVKFRYKEPSGDKSMLIVKTVKDSNMKIEDASPDFKFASAVALFGMQLRKSDYIDNFKTSEVVALAEAGKGIDKEGYRAEFIRLVNIQK